MYGSLVVIGGHSRHVGKTTAMEAVLRGLPPREWIAVKVSAHSHAGGQTVVEEHDESSGTQTARYLQAGARRALLLRSPNDAVASAAEYIAALRAAGHNVIVESNRLVQHCEPDLVLFVVAPHIQDWKPSSAACIARADALVVLGEEDLPHEIPHKGFIPLFRLPSACHHESLSAWVLSNLTCVGA